MIILEKNIPKVIRILSQFVLARRQSMQFFFFFLFQIEGIWWEKVSRGSGHPFLLLHQSRDNRGWKEGKEMDLFFAFLGYSQEWQPDETKQRETSCCIKRTQTKAMVVDVKHAISWALVQTPLWPDAERKKTNDDR